MLVAMVVVEGNENVCAEGAIESNIEVHRSHIGVCILFLDGVRGLIEATINNARVVFNKFFSFEVVGVGISCSSRCGIALLT